MPRARLAGLLAPVMAAGMVLGSGTPVAAVSAAGPGGAAGRPGQPSLALGRQMSMSATSTTGVRQGNERSGCIANLDRDLNTRERVGQLVWVGLAADQAPTGVDSVVTTNRLGGVVLLGGFHSGITATAKTTAHVHGLSDTRARIAIAADQEGGYVQQVQGSGVSTIPTAFVQGRTYGPSTTLRNLTTRWGGQLAAAGIDQERVENPVDVNLAPVADTVAKDFMSQNGPIGRYQRNYDYVSSRVAADVGVVIAGMHAGGVATTVKHFPGLGRITGNTDTTAVGITDTTTTVTLGYLDPFAAGIAAGADLVMISNAWYSKLDATHQAPFSSAIVTGLLRGQLGYRGTVVSDDLGNAVAVSSVPVALRATRFIRAGGDIVLTADPSTVPTMTRAIMLARASSPTFKALMDAAVLRVLTMKTERGLTRCS